MDYRKEVERIRQREEQQRLSLSQAYVQDASMAKTKKKSKKLILSVLIFVVAAIVTGLAIYIMRQNNTRYEGIDWLKKNSTTEQIKDAKEELKEETSTEEGDKEKSENNENGVPHKETTEDAEENNEENVTTASTSAGSNSEGSPVDDRKNPTHNLDDIKAKPD